MTRRRYGVTAILVGTVVFAASAAYYSGALATLEDKIFDRFFIATPPSPSVIVVGIDDESIQTLGGWPFARATFARALDNLKGARAVGFDIILADPSIKGPLDDRALVDALERADFPVVVPFAFDDRGGKTNEPLPLFAAHSTRGYANLLLDSDAVVRQFEPERQGQLSFSAALLSSAPLPHGPVRIKYRGPAKTFTTIPFIDLYEGKVPPSAVQGKTVLIGVTAPDLHDIVTSPFGALPGVEVQANAFSTLEGGAFFKTVPPALVFIAILFASVLAASLIVYLSRLWLLLVLLAAGLAAITLFSIVLFSAGVLFPTLAVSLAFGVSAGAVLVYQYLSESKEKKFIRETFQYYLMPEVIDQLIKNPEKVALGGERRTLAILFSDIRGFTTIAEGLAPEALTEIMNEYLTAMTDVILSERGLVDKYIGDAVMAFWGAPLANPTQARDACRSVLLMAERLRELNALWHTRGLPPVEIGVGINLGEVIVGNMGSATRFNYTVMGDAVNLASRLEGLTKAYGVRCIISESVEKEIRDEPGLRTRELDLVRVKGKTEARRIFELLTEPVDETRERMLEAFSEGRVEYEAGQWRAARARFEAALAFGPDAPTSLYLERCRELLAHPPAEWDGVYEFKTK